VLKSLSGEPAQSPGDYFVWSVQQRPVSVHLSLSAVNALDVHVRNAMGTLPRRGLEVGGLLLGRVKNPNPGQYIVSVERFQPVEIEHLRGPSYILSAGDRDQLRQQLRKLERSKDGLSVVGFYRSHTRPGLYLDEYDFDLLKSYFAHPSSVALLIRPAPDRPATAGFFFWEDGEIHRARTYREFPLSTDSLRPQQPVERPDASAPMASPLPAIKNAPVPQQETNGITVLAPARQAAQAKAGSTLTLRNPFVVWTAVAVATLISLAALRQAGDAPSKRAHNVLSLNAEPSQSGLRLTWDRTNPLIAQHGSATLSITDGSEEKQIVLDAAQLKTGALVYWPTSPDVNFRLQLGGVSESLRAIAPPLPPKPAAETPVAEASAVAASPPKTLLASVPAQQLEPGATRSRAGDVRAPVAPILPPDRKSPKPKPPALIADIEPVRASGFKKTIGAIPRLLVGKNRDDAFVPAKAVRQVNPNLPGSVKLPEDTRVSVKVSLDETGQVTGTDLVTRDVDTRLANAAMDAARRWRFKPAREQRRPVASAVILHFRFSREGDGS
jgi:TonB family protein